MDAVQHQDEMDTQSAPGGAAGGRDAHRSQSPPHAMSSVNTLPSVRVRILEALRREDVDTIRQELPHYQDLLQQAIEQSPTSAERMMRLEAEHQRFHEQLRASLLTMRIALRLDLERVRAAKQYQSSGKASAAIDMEG
jgi:hypothetical protein